MMRACLVVCLLAIPACSEKQVRETVQTEQMTEGWKEVIAPSGDVVVLRHAEKTQGQSTRQEQSSMTISFPMAPIQAVARAAALGLNIGTGGGALGLAGTALALWQRQKNKAAVEKALHTTPPQWKDHA